MDGRRVGQRDQAIACRLQFSKAVGDTPNVLVFDVAESLLDLQVLRPLFEHAADRAAEPGRRSVEKQSDGGGGPDPCDDRTAADMIKISHKVTPTSLTQSPTLSGQAHDSHDFIVG